MAKIELEIDDAILERAQSLAEAEHHSLQDFLRNTIQEKTVAAPVNTTLGLFADDPEVMDAVMQDVLASRAQQRMRDFDEAAD